MYEKYVSPYKKSNEGPASYDIGIHSVFKVEDNGVLIIGGDGSVKQSPKLIPVAPRDNTFRLGPGSYLFVIHETIRVPEDSIGMVVPRSRLIRAANVYFQSGLYDPGYIGNGRIDAFVARGMFIFERYAPIFQVVFLKPKEIIKLYDGSYQGETWRD